jgi:hypothetical protein
VWASSWSRVFMVAVGPPGGGLRSPWARVRVVVRPKRRRVVFMGLEVVSFQVSGEGEELTGYRFFHGNAAV